MSKQIETWITRINSENEGVKKISAIFETYVAIADSTVKLLKLYQKKGSDRVEEGVRKSKEIVNQVNKLNEEIVQFNRDWGFLKQQFTVFKAYEGKLSDILCSLRTTSKTNCANPALEQETI
nr:hypothetical protein [Candidatus Mycoplasma haematolamae]